MKHVRWFSACALLCALWAGEAAGLGAPPELRIAPECVVSSRRVTLFDLCDPAGIPSEWKARLLGADLGEAPGAGSEKYIEGKRLRAFLGEFFASHGASAEKMSLSVPGRVVVRRASREIPRAQIEDIFRRFVIEHAPWDPRDVTVRDVSVSGLAVVPEGPLTHEVTAAPREKWAENVAVTIDFFVDGDRVRSLRAAGKVDVMAEVVHARRALKRGDVIEAADVEARRVNVAQLASVPDRMAQNPDEVVGKRLLRGVGLQQPIAVGDCARSLVVRRGAAVAIVFSAPGMRVAARGEVREDGAEGDTVKVVNAGSGRAILCRVRDAGTVEAVQ